MMIAASRTDGSMIEIWRVQIGARDLGDRLGSLLDARERDRARRFVRSADARRYRIAHGALRAILSERTGIPPAEISFEPGTHGKPQLPAGPQFSISHSGELTVIAVSDERAVGVDVERVRPVPDAAALAERYFAAPQARAIAARRPPQRDLRFLRYWTAIEAVLKADGSGLAGGELSRLELQSSGLEGANIYAESGGRVWSVRWLSLGDGYVGAVAAGGGELTVRVRGFG
jgi:4'-phosphopantetheinyl transferase